MTDDLKEIYATDKAIWCEDMATLIEEDRTQEMDFDNLRIFLMKRAAKERKKAKKKLKKVKCTCGAEITSAVVDSPVITHKKYCAIVKAGGDRIINLYG